MPSLSFPLINGVRASWAEIEFTIANLPTLGIQEISYKPAQDPNPVYGAGVLPVGRTRGQVSFEASFTLLKEEADLLIDALAKTGKSRGLGFGEVSFDVFLSYRMDALAATPGQIVVHNDQIVGCRIKSPDQGHSQGSDGLKTKFELSVMDILLNGSSITGKRFA